MPWEAEEEEEESGLAPVGSTPAPASPVTFRLPCTAAGRLGCAAPICRTHAF